MNSEEIEILIGKWEELANDYRYQAGKNLNRNFIGMELDEDYFNIAKERIENHEVDE